MRIVGYVVALTLIALMMGDVTSFVDMPSLGLVVGFTIWGYLASAGCATRTALGVTFGKGPADPKALQTGLRAVRSSRHAALAGGFVAVAAGLMVMLKAMGDPSRIGPGMALSLLGFLWAAVIAYVLLLPLQAGIERRMQVPGGPVTTHSETPLDLMMLGAGFLITLISFAVLVASIKQG
jgi:hypothetical protein